VTSNRSAAVRVVTVVATTVTVAGAIASQTLGWGLIPFTVTGAVLLWYRSENRIGWLLTGIGTFQGAAATTEWWRPEAGVGAALSSIVGTVGLVGIGLVPFLVLLFPTGALPSRRWRHAARIAAAALGGLYVLDLVRTDGGDGGAKPLAVAALDPLVGALWGPLTVIVVAFGFAAIGAAVGRARRARGDEREQMRWFAASVALLPLFAVGNGFAIGHGWHGPFLIAGFTLVPTAIAVAIGVAVLRYRLYAIDVVINKALVYGLLAGAVTALYAAIVGGIGSLVDRSGSADVVLSASAAGITALIFQPVRHRFQIAANRLVYGTRLSPYEAVEAFAHRVAAFSTFETVLPQIAEAAAISVGAERSRVRLYFPHGGEERAVWTAEGVNVDAHFDRLLPVVDGGESIGEIAVAKRRGEAVTSNDDRVLAALAAEAALAMRGLRLTDELKQRLVDLQESGRRLVEAQDDERRRMERDLHDGAQQQLIAMKIRIGLAKSYLEDDVEQVATLLDELGREVSETIETIRELARGLFPPVLAERGLVAAVQAHVAKHGMDATVEVMGTPVAIDAAAEANVYFIVREALQNASKYAPGAPVSIDFEYGDGRFGFAIRDGGPGFDTANAKRGSGSQNMRDRIAALGGSFDVVSSPGEGTEVRGSIPTALAAAVTS
jgi:signal transduction histidine kinase